MWMLWMFCEKNKANVQTSYTRYFGRMLEKCKNFIDKFWTVNIGKQYCTVGFVVLYVHKYVHCPTYSKSQKV